MTPALDRDQFEVTRNYTYLNHAAVGVLPASTRNALNAFIDAHAAAGVMGVFKTELQLPHYRAAVAGFIGASAREIAILRNTGDGANVVAAGLDWRPGDEIVISDNEFGANAYPWLACRDRGVNVRFVETAKERMTPDVLRKLMTANTRVVAVSWVSFSDGYRHDLPALAAVAHERGALFCVDVIQGLGPFTLDVRASGIDAAYGGGAKWLMALQGVSFLYVREELIGKLRLANPGWRSSEDMWNFLDYSQGPVDDASRFEGGTPNFIGALSLAESIAVLRSGRDMDGYVLALTDRLSEGLVRLGARLSTVRAPGASSGIVTFSVPDCDPVALGKILQEERIVTTYRSNGVRVSPHAYNTFEEIDHLLEVTAQAVPVLTSA